MSVRFASAAALAAVLAAPVLSQARDCTDAAGAFSAEAPESCTSPIGICTHGKLTGGLRSTYDFVADTQDDSGPVASLTGHSTITLAKGKSVLHGQDTSTVAHDNGAFTTTVKVAGGTRQYEHASGTVVAIGTFDFTTHATKGTYNAHICKHPASVSK